MHGEGGRGVEGRWGGGGGAPRGTFFGPFAAGERGAGGWAGEGLLWELWRPLPHWRCMPSNVCSTEAPCAHFFVCAAYHLLLVPWGHVSLPGQGCKTPEK